MSNNLVGGHKLDDIELVDLLQKAANEGVEGSDSFFNRFLIGYDLGCNNYSGAAESWRSLLYKLMNLSPDAYQKVHKGTPFYWLGAASFLMCDYQTATYFFDAAISEDIRNGNDPSPAFNYLHVNSSPDNQAAKKLVEIIQKRFDSVILIYKDYISPSGKLQNLSMDFIRDNFLSPALLPNHKEWRTLANTLISFISEWDYRNSFFHIVPTIGSLEPFYFLLIRGCILFESLVRLSPRTSKDMKYKELLEVLKSLENYLNITIPSRMGSIKLDSIIVDIKSANNDISTAIKFTIRLRNSISHNIGYVERITKMDYQKLNNMVASSCIHAIATLY